MNQEQQPPVIVGLGEILWDVFPDGPRFGGAPANFACHVAALGGNAEMVSAVGTEALGHQAIATLDQRRVGTSAVHRDDDRATGTVTVSLDDDGHASYEFAADAAWDALPWTDRLARLAAGATAVCFGTLGQRGERSRHTIQQFVAATRPTALRIFDINLRPPFVSDSVIHESISLANVLKLNDEELAVLKPLYGLSGSEHDMLRELAERFSLRALALTRGQFGAVLVRGDEISEQPGVDIRVVDTVGAGDAFTAAFAIGLILDHNLDEINRNACQVAAFVCSRRGATPEMPPELVRL